MFTVNCNLLDAFQNFLGTSCSLVPIHIFLYFILLIDIIMWSNSSLWSHFITSSSQLVLSTPMWRWWLRLLHDDEDYYQSCCTYMYLWRPHNIIIVWDFIGKLLLWESDNHGNGLVIKLCCAIMIKGLSSRQVQ